MGYQDYISESEASSLAGVSVTTLARFAETGYLHTETDSDGLKLVSKAELSSLFGLDIEADRISPEDIKEIKLAGQETDSIENRSSSEEAPPLEELVTGRPPAKASEQKSVAIEALEREVLKLKNILDIQEKILDLREEQIAGLSKERDWLRSRVERTEEKIERDQLLLLSETQIIRNIMLMQQRKRSPLRATLEWFGLADPVQAPQAAKNGTFEISSKPFP